MVNGTYYTDGRAGMAGDYASEQRGNSRGGRGRDGNGGRGGRGGVGGNGVLSALAGGMPGGNIAAQEKSRALYVGSVPDGVTLEEVAADLRAVWRDRVALGLCRAKSWCAAESLHPSPAPSSDPDPRDRPTPTPLVSQLYPNCTPRPPNYPSRSVFLNFVTERVAEALTRSSPSHQTSRSSIRTGSASPSTLPRQGLATSRSSSASSTRGVRFASTRC